MMGDNDNTGGNNTGDNIGDLSVEDRAFRDALGRFASGVTIVTTVLDGVDHAMTASAFTSVSLEPRLVLVCSQKTNRFHQAVETSRFWAVSILADSGQYASTKLARKNRELSGQLDDIPHHRGASGAALIDDALAWLECRTTQAHDGGDHAILVGEVTAARVRHDADEPLLYYRSHYGRLIHTDQSEKQSDKQSEKQGEKTR